MSSRPLLPRLLFWLVCAVSFGMLGLLLAAPWVETSSPLLRLLAEDAVVRRTTFASALGLLVTASVFFRPSPPDGPRKRPRQDAVGA
jgi:hypothetical protein